MEEVIKEGTLRMLTTETSCDVILSCQGHRLMAHKIILSIASPVLQVEIYVRNIFIALSKPNLRNYKTANKTRSTHKLNIYNAVCVFKKKTLA